MMNFISNQINSQQLEDPIYGWISWSMIIACTILLIPTMIYWIGYSRGQGKSWINILKELF